jgi:hypothetical protein
MMRTEQLKDGTVTHCHTDAAIEAAELDVLGYLLTHGEQRPGDLEDHFCGEPTDIEVMCDMLGRWFRSPYFPALGRLVDRGEVTWRCDESGDVWYRAEVSDE